MPKENAFAWLALFIDKPHGRSQLMHIKEILWKEAIIEKLADKHGVSIEEVEEVLFSKPHVRLAERGHVQGEDLYLAFGQTEQGRYLVVFFIRKVKAVALPISARDMTSAERKYYNAQKKGH